MDPILNPFAPGAGTPPPELAGRDDLRETIRVAIGRVRRVLPTKSILMVGLRGVGKTVLLDRMREDAEATGIHAIRIEAPESRSLPALLAPQLRQALLRLSRNEQARDLAQRALRALAGFAKTLKIKYQDIEVGIDFEPEAGLADNGDLEYDLQALLETVGLTAQKASTAFVLFIDELQYVQEEELAALIMELHRTAQRRLPVVLVGAGLPQLRGRMGQAKSYAERLFDFPEIGALPPPDAKIAMSRAWAERHDSQSRNAPSFSPTEEYRLNQLNAAVGERDLTPAEEAEQHSLIAAYHRSVLRRAKALAVLAQRGHCVPLTAETEVADHGMN